MRAAVESQEEKARARNVAVIEEVESGLVVTCEKSRVERVLVNLISNAPDDAPQVQGGGQDEVPHLGVVAVVAEAGDQLAPGAVMPGPHAGRNDEHPGSHDGQG